MLETLYKTRSPKEVPAEKAEYYELILDQGQDHKKKMVYFVREMHGWWSQQEKRPIHSLTTFSPEDGFPTWEAARERYMQQREHRAKEGFVHSFSPHYYGEREHEYELIKV